MSADLELQYTLIGHTGRVWCCCWSPCGTYLATCGEDKTIRIWFKDICQTILTEGHSRTIRQISWSQCSKFLASASFDGTIAIWNRQNENGKFECNVILEGHENEVKSVAFSPSGQFLATCSRDKSVWIWDRDDGEFIISSVLQAHSQDVKKVKWHPSLDILVSCSYDNKIKFFKEEDDDWICISTLEGHESTVWSIDFNSTGSQLVSVSEDKNMIIWKEFFKDNQEGIQSGFRESTWKSICKISGVHTMSIYDVSWSSLNELIVSASRDNAIRIFKKNNELSTSENEPFYEVIYSQYQAHEEDVNSVTWNPKDKSILASASDDGSAKIWLCNEHY